MHDDHVRYDDYAHKSNRCTVTVGPIIIICCFPTTERAGAGAAAESGQTPL